MVQKMQLAIQKYEQQKKKKRKRKEKKREEEEMSPEVGEHKGTHKKPN